MYEYVALKRNGKRIDEHRLIMEQHLGRKLRSDEVVHHINENKSDNRIENLQVLTRSEHAKKHYRSEVVNNLESRQKRAVALSRVNRETLGPTAKETACYDFSGELVKIYPSIRSVEEDGFQFKHVTACVNHKRATHCGYVWVDLKEGYPNFPFSAIKHEEVHIFDELTE